MFSSTNTQNCFSPARPSPSYIETYRTPWRKVGEQNYYFTCFQSGAKFISGVTADNLEACNLKISREEFEEKYGRAKSALDQERRARRAGQMGGVSDGGGALSSAGEQAFSPQERGEAAGDSADDVDRGGGGGPRTSIGGAGTDVYESDTMNRIPEELADHDRRRSNNPREPVQESVDLLSGDFGPPGDFEAAKRDDLVGGGERKGSSPEDGGGTTPLSEDGGTTGPSSSGAAPPRGPPHQSAPRQGAAPDHERSGQSTPVQQHLPSNAFLDPAGPPTSSGSSAELAKPRAHHNIQVDRLALARVSLRFRNVPTARELKVGDVDDLLSEYKEMAAIIASLKQATESLVLRSSHEAGGATSSESRNSG